MPENFYYLSPKDSETILTEVWGNPPGSATGILGMLFPADSTPFDGGSWGVTIEYEADGNVSDEDADSIDYGELLADMQSSTREASKVRVLGREGVLVLNFVAGMEQIAVIDGNLDGVLALAEFNQGSRYEDFDPELDKVAAYGIGALVAGKLAVKAGLFASALILLKKFGIFIVIAFGALFKKFFKRKPTQPEA